MAQVIACDQGFSGHRPRRRAAPDEDESLSKTGIEIAVPAAAVAPSSRAVTDEAGPAATRTRTVAWSSRAPSEAV